jgi:hypothetical protein
MLALINKQFFLIISIQFEPTICAARPITRDLIMFFNDGLQVFCMFCTHVFNPKTIYY